MSEETKASLLLIRHGQTDWNKAGKMQGQVDIPLNERGREQAHETGAKLKAEGYQFDVLVSSPLSRAFETAQIIGSYLGLTVEKTYDNLVERAYGEAEGAQLTYEESRTVYEDFDGVESEREVFERTVKVLLDIAEDHPGQRVIAVAHGSVIRRALSAGQGFEWKESVPNAVPLEVSIDGLRRWSVDTEPLVLAAESKLK